MRTSEFIPQKQAIEHPKCPECRTQMWLARIEPDKPDHDRRTFECPECEHVVTEVVKFR